MRFTGDWREDVTLRSGDRILLRFIHPEDKHNLEEGIARLSDESSYRRFFTTKHHLTAKELRYLTEVDGRDHVAIVAGKEHPDGSEEGYGVARFIRSKTDATCAEFAVVVATEVQGMGIGTLLLQRLTEAALERGVQTFTGEFLADNHSIRQVVDRIGRHRDYRSTSSLVRVTVSL